MTMVVAICVAGLAGLVTVLTTASYYRGSDGPAFAISLLMGAAFCAGITELLQVTRRTGRLHGELRGLPTDDCERALQGASPLLRALLRARLDRTVLPVPGPVFSPYLVGLLIMLGLLGTFLGLFETLRGASTALSAGADIEALRAGLQQPMRGLMRSFGTSAAGVASSAMLGLGAVFARRAAGQLGLALHTLASGPFARLSPARRQLVALEALAAQGEALPEAARALGAATAELCSLRDSFRDAHAETTAENRKAFGEVTVESRRALGEVAAESRKALGEVTAELRELREAWQLAHAEATTESREALGELTGESRKALGEVTTELHALGDAWRDAHAGATAESRRAFGEVTTELHALGDSWQRAHAESAAQTQAALGAAIEEVRGALAGAVDGAANAAGAAVSPVVEAGVQQALAAVGSHLDAVRAAAEADGARRQRAHGQALEALQARTEALLGGFETADARLRAEAQAHAATLEQQMGEAAERDAQRAQAFADAAEQMQRDLAEAAGAVRTRLDAGAQVEQAQQARADALLSAMQRTSDRIGEAVAAQVEDLRHFVEATDSHLRTAEAQSQERQATLTQQLSSLAEAQQQQVTALTEQQADRVTALLEGSAEKVDALLQAGRQQSAEREAELVGQLAAQAAEHTGALAQMQTQLAEQHAERTAALTELLGKHVADIDGAVTRSTDLLQQAATLVQGGGAELLAVAETFGEAVERQRQAAEQWLASLGDVERSVTEAGEAAAADVLGQHLARTHEVFDRQLRFQQELLEQLQGGTPPAAMTTQVVDATA